MSKRPASLAKGGGDGIRKAAQSIRVAQGLTGQKADEANIRDVLKIHKVSVTAANVALIRSLTGGGS